ncbi:hypothetical protein GGR50DRAFT_10645 [Xylaria sp. CBS 124048]|nr:hypothetical protein GGR50DRAFT_10645 [Xylaria sp. CBS 124048]
MNMLNYSEELGYGGEFGQSMPLPRKEYRCPQCPSTFKRSENLKRHQRGHNGCRKYVCPTCAKSFVRSDILSRHTAVHKSREWRGDYPHKRRACRECARVRERCSRGEPCERCAAKSLCCFYPEEPRFRKTTTPYILSPSPKSGIDGTTSESSPELQSPSGNFVSTDSTPLSDQPASLFGTEDSAIPSQWPSISSHLSHVAMAPYNPHYGEDWLASPRVLDTLSPQEEGIYSVSPRHANGDDMGSSSGTTQSAIYKTSASVERQSSDGPKTLLRIHHRTPTPALPLPLTLDYLQMLESHDEPVRKVHRNQDTTFDWPIQATQPPPRLVDLKVYELIASTFKGFQDPLPRLGTTATSSPLSRTGQHDFFLKLYFKYL